MVNNFIEQCYEDNNGVLYNTEQLLEMVKDWEDPNPPLVVKEYDGMVDKYIGDAMMAIFNAPIDLPNHETAAVLCAKEIQDQFKLADIGVEIGVGINTGEAVIGNCGSSTRFDYTAIGSAVNIAARCESSCKAVGVDLIIAEETAKNCGFKLKSLQPIEVKGISEPLKIYTWE